MNSMRKRGTKTLDYNPNPTDAPSALYEEMMRKRREAYTKWWHDEYLKILEEREFADAEHETEKVEGPTISVAIEEAAGEDWTAAFLQEDPARRPFNE